MQGITALLIIKNEAPWIERALLSVSWCDEIVVVDSGSTDGTLQIVQTRNKPWSSKLTLLSEPWRGYAGQRNFAMGQAKNDWVFFLDGDEACSPELAKTIQNIANPTGNHYQIRRQEYFLGRPVNYGTWNPSYHVRLFNRKEATYEREIHEDVVMKNNRVKIEDPIYHCENLRLERLLEKMNRYTSLEAERDFEQGHRTNTAMIALAFPAMFIKNFFYFSAYKDGYAGFIISVMEGISRTIRQIKVWQLQRLRKTNSAPWYQVWRGHPPKAAK